MPPLKYSKPCLRPSDLRAVTLCLRRGQIDAGPRVGEFRRLLAASLDLPEHYVIPTNSCTTALGLLRPFFEGRGFYDMSWRFPVLTWPSTYTWLRRVNRSMDDVGLDGLRRPHENDARYATMWVSLWGQYLADHDFTLRGNQYWPRALDAAQTLAPEVTGGPALYHHGPLLAAGHVDAICYSLAPLKELCGLYAGAFVAPMTPDESRRLEAFLDSGTIGREWVHERGGHGLMLEPAAACAISQWRRIHTVADYRRHLLEIYSRCLPQSVLKTLPSQASGHLCVIQLANRNSLQQALKRAGYLSGVHYRMPDWFSRRLFPVAHWLADSILTLPLHAEVTCSHVRDICRVVTKHYETHGPAAPPPII